jgi:DNA-binding PadR family transcriptional regulator
MARKSALDEGILTDVAFYILASVIDENHGYMIMKDIHEFTNQQLVIGPASLYTTLKKLLDASYIERIKTDDENAKMYKITPEGLSILQKDILRKEQMITYARHFIDEKQGGKKQ